MHLHSNVVKRNQNHFIFDMFYFVYSSFITNLLFNSIFRTEVYTCLKKKKYCRKQHKSNSISPLQNNTVRKKMYI